MYKLWKQQTHKKQYTQTPPTFQIAKRKGHVQPPYEIYKRLFGWMDFQKMYLKVVNVAEQPVPMAVDKTVEWRIP